MTIELTPAEIDLLEKALSAWKEEPNHRGMRRALLKATLTGELTEREMLTMMVESLVECQDRARASLPLRNRLAQLSTDREPVPVRN